MENFFYLSLFIFGTLFWSFASVLIYRLKSGEKWILNWRSHCPKCNNILEVLELIPIFSWLKNLWKCHYCKEKISNIYPLLELSTWILFALIWYFLIDYTQIYSLNIFEIIKLIFWLNIWFITILYTFYDLIFLEIHDWIMFSWIILALLLLSFNTILNNNLIISVSSILLSWTIIWWLYIIMLKELKEIYDILIILWSVLLLYIYKIIFWIDLTNIQIFNGIIWALLIFVFFFLQILVSRWAWMWWWDLRIAIMIGLLLWTSLIFPALMITYMIWSIIWILFIIYWKIMKKWTTINAQIPFWPFLALWFFITIFYNTEILNIMSIYF
jgi:prepilin signal peptidase PulO-like enzyme (type II secretory pathway)